MAEVGELLPELDDLWASRVRDTAAADGVYATLREAIALGRLKPGDRLPEEGLARRFGISRTPVREAILRLEVERLATRIPRRGLVVRTMSEDEVRQFYEVRIGLDSLAARLAVLHSLPADRVELRWVNQRLAEVAARNGDVEEMDMLTRQFHDALYRATHNSIFLDLTRQINDRVRGFGGSTFTHPGWATQVVTEHEGIIAAIEAGNADQAERLARDHKTNARTVRMTLLRTDGGSSSS